jgi:DNA-binding MarR family transcriptional regulator
MPDVMEQIARDFFSLIPLLKNKFIRPYERVSSALSPMQFHVLLRLKDQKPRSMSELASEMDILKQQLTYVTDKLADEGFIQRVPCRRDRRSVQISITPAGLDYLEAFKKEILQLIAGKFAHLPPEDLRELGEATRTLHRIVDRL